MTTDYEQLCKKIAGRLSGLNVEELSTAERQISRLLLSAELLDYDEYDNLIESVPDCNYV